LNGCLISAFTYDTTGIAVDTIVTTDTTIYDTTTAYDTTATFDTTSTYDTTTTIDTTYAIDTTSMTDSLRAGIFLLDDIVIENYLFQAVFVNEQQNLKSGLWTSLKGREVSINYILPEGRYSGLLSLHDLQGRLIHTWDIDNQGGILNQVTVPQKMAQGMYLLNLQSKNRQGKTFQKQIKVMLTE